MTGPAIRAALPAGCWFAATLVAGTGAGLLPALLLGLAALVLQWRSLARLPRAWLAAGGLVALGTALATLVAPERDLALPRAATALAATGLVLALAATRLDHLGPPARTRLLATFALVPAALAIGAAAVTTDWPAKFLDLDLPRLALLPTHPNQTAGTMVLLLPLLGAVAWSRVPAGIRGVAAVLTLACLVILVLTQSRSGWAGTGAGVVVLGLVLAGVPWLLAVLGTFGAAIAGLAGLYLTGAGGTGSGLDSAAGRADVWQRAALMIVDFPVTGIGPGQFDLVLDRFYPSAIVFPEEAVPHAHQVLLQAWLDLGLFGFLGLAVWFAVAWLRAPSPRQRDLVSALGWGSALGLAGFLTYGLGDTISFASRGVFPLAVVLGLALLSTRLRALPALDQVGGVAQQDRQVGDGRSAG